ncbi:hypothetical protein BDZ45DRAFT_423866 [Acephala macrosclerotiorum]|nr:hypothetical protein BDZ45DRAFT_423866 [Acephala macrosclerotiorum]
MAFACNSLLGTGGPVWYSTPSPPKTTISTRPFTSNQRVPNTSPQIPKASSTVPRSTFTTMKLGPPTTVTHQTTQALSMTPKNTAPATTQKPGTTSTTAILLSPSQEADLSHASVIDADSSVNILKSKPNNSAARVALSSINKALDAAKIASNDSSDSFFKSAFSKLIDALAKASTAAEAAVASTTAEDIAALVAAMTAAKGK